MRIAKSILLFLLLASSSGFAQDDIRIPNIISPNGDDVNDVFFIRATGYEALSCSIFNRYGQPIYRYYGLNGTWDGYTHAGVLVSPGTYFVFVEVTTEDGSIQTRQGTLQVHY